MYTRCPACQAVYELQARLLAEAAGVVRCGNCGKTFNSLTELFENHPDDTLEPLRGQGMPPMLDQPAMVQTELLGDDPAWAEPDLELEPASDELAVLPLEPMEASHRPELWSWFWPATSAVLLLVLLVQSGMIWNRPGSAFSNWLGASTQIAQTTDPNEVIQIVSRDLHPHPGLDDAVVISASLRNQSSSAVPFPIIEVRFYDASQQVLGVQRVTPEQYLDDPDRIGRGLAAGLLMPLLLEFVVGTSEPAGFQMRFF